MTVTLLLVYLPLALRANLRSGYLGYHRLVCHFFGTKPLTPRLLFNYSPHLSKDAQGMFVASLDENYRCLSSGTASKNHGFPETLVVWRDNAVLLRPPVY